MRFAPPPGLVPGLLALLPCLTADCPPVGGQAVMEGVMMRNGDTYGLAVRRPDGVIRAQRLPWFSLTRHAWLKKPFVRGFPVLLETLVNGIQALNRSVEAAAQGEEEELSGWHLALSLGLALVMAVALFVVAPHLLSLVMLWLHLGGDVEGLSFHLWDGFFKCCIFMGYIRLISYVPDIRRVFQYHGAEHKTIACYEAGDALTVENVRKYTRFHPRCGTSFLILVVIVSVFLYSVLPWSSTGLRVVFKLLLLPVVMGISYELLKWCGRSDNLATRIIRQPGIWVQHLTVFEPDDSMIEVAIAAVTPVLPEDPEDGRW